MAAAAGINWFNHREKMEVSSVPPELPDRFQTGRISYFEVEALMLKYFSRCQTQHIYIMTMQALIADVNFMVDRWDLIQASHEAELSAMREAMYEAKAYKLARRVEELENQLIQRLNEIKNLKNRRPILNDEYLDKVIEAVNKAQPMMAKDGKSARRAARHHLQNLIQKLESAMKKNGIDVDQV